MPSTESPGPAAVRDTAGKGRALLASRVAATPEILAGLPERFPSLMAGGESLPRCVVTTGVGTSEGHARHLAELAAGYCDQPARFASTGSLSAGAPPGASADWLIVFSQGLSANARFALTDVGAWGRVFLVTGLHRGLSEEEGLSAEKRAWLDVLESRGVTLLDLGCGAEYGALLRVMGARAGYVIAWGVLRSLAERRLADAGAVVVDPRKLRAAQEGAAAAAARVFADESSLVDFFDSERTLLIVGEAGVLEFAEQLTLKLAEGMLRPQPRAVDVLEFAHGPLQSVADRPASILFLVAGDESAESARWRARFEATLNPERHDLRVVRAGLCWPFAAVEYEAIFDAFVLRALDATNRDLVDWPGAAREAVLYDAGPALPAPGGRSRRRSIRFEERVWPELEAVFSEGHRTALLGLGSIEQHGPHLPLGTDRWIAEALLAGLATRLEDAVAVPAVAIGCASEHLDFAGTLHVAPATLEALLTDLLRSLSHHGFERAFLFTAHGGNVDALRAMRDRLVLSARPLLLHVETDLRVGAMQSAAVAAQGLSPLAAGPHAGEYETSLVAYLRPGAVRHDRLAPGREVTPGEAQGLFYPSLRPNTSTGVLGDPSTSAADRGERYLCAWLDLLEQGYRAVFPPSSDVAEKKRA